MKTLLHNAGYKATPGRLALLEVLQKSKRPLSIQSIMRKLKGKKIDQVTLYRNLDALEKAKLVRKVDLRHGHADYELAGKDHHHHLSCLGCGEVRDFGGWDLKPIIRKVLRSNPDFDSISEHSLEFFGLCKDCALIKEKP